MTPLETAAKAAYEQYYCGLGRKWEDTAIDGERARWIASTRAALETLMSPDDEMITAGAAKLDPAWGYPHADKLARNWAAGTFTAMLTKVLEG